MINNDVYVMQDDLVNVLRVTTDGSLNVLNGVPAWVYEGLAKLITEKKKKKKKKITQLFFC